MKSISYVFTLASCLLTHQSLAEVKPARIFGSDMVLQQRKPITIWGSADAGEKVSVKLGADSVEAKADADGAWSVELPAREASYDPLSLKINSITFDNILIGEVWICSGQSNMGFDLAKVDGAKSLKTDNSNLRIAKHESLPNVAKSGYSMQQLERCNTEDFFQVKWHVSEQKVAMQTSGVGWVFGNELQKTLDVPVAIIPVAVGGSAMNNWLPEELARKHPITKGLYESDWLSNPEVKIEHQKRMKDAFQKVLKPNQKYKVGDLPYRWLCEPDFLFESGIAPLRGLAFRGVAWYQGEADSNDETAINNAGTLLPLMIESWRKELGQGDFPFLLVQLPGYGRETWPEFREVQRSTADNDENTSLVVTVDLGSKKNIHPKDKIPIGERLSQLAQADVYQTQGVLSAPQLEEAKVVSGGVALRFSEVGNGFKSVKGEIPGFEVADSSGNFKAVEAELAGKDGILLKTGSQKVAKVRYAWQPYPTPKLVLYSEQGLPLGPFETSLK